jgi:hypothetical protein
VRVDATIIDYLRNAEHRSVQSIVEDRSFTGPIANFIRSAVDDNDARQAADETLADETLGDETLGDEAATIASQAQGFAPSAVNNVADQRTLDKAITAYRWSWALCHFLAENENYREQFGKLGQIYLTGARPRFDHVFADHGGQIEAEFRQFMQQLGQGYRVDLCHWDWNNVNKPIHKGQKAKTKVCSRRGFQTSGFLVNKGSTYAIETVGRWSITSDGAELDANGQADGAGVLTANVLTGTQMGPPIEIGVDGTFIAEESGTLFFRCRDSWLELADNRGCIRVSIRHVADEE